MKQNKLFALRMTILLVAIIFSVAVNAQTKDTAQKPEFPGDSIPILTVKQINVVLKEMRGAITIEQAGLYELLLSEIQKQINEGVIEWRKRKKKN